MTLLGIILTSAGIVWGGILVYAAIKNSRNEWLRFEVDWEARSFLRRFDDHDLRLKHIEDRVHDLELRLNERTLVHNVEIKSDVKLNDKEIERIMERVAAAARKSTAY